MTELRKACSEALLGRDVVMVEESEQVVTVFEETLSQILAPVGFGDLRQQGITGVFNRTHLPTIFMRWGFVALLAEPLGAKQKRLETISPGTTVGVDP